jgi:hypothetical protein
MTPEYIRDLAVLKSSFLPGNEADVITLKLVEQLLGPDLSIIDVGTGAGRALIRITHNLRSVGHVVDATAIDVFFRPSVISNLAAEGITARELDFMRYQASEPANIITAIQSLYYFDVRLAIRHMFKQLRTHGIVAIVLWDDDCVLRRVAAENLDGRGSLLSVDTVLSALHCDGLFSLIANEIVSSPVFLSRWLESPDHIQSIANVLSRQAAPSLNRIDLTRFTASVRSLGDIQERRNRVIIARRKEKQC